jgi:hypothetical protein
MTAVVIGYARISTEDQNLALQRDAFTQAGCTRIYEDRSAGRYCRKGDARKAVEGRNPLPWGLVDVGAPASPPLPAALKKAKCRAV